MDALETLIRDTLVEHAVDAPPVSAPAVPHRRRWPAVVLAAATVVGLAVGLSFALPGGGHDRDPVTSPDTRRPASGTKTIYYAGVSIVVPVGLWPKHSFCSPSSGFVVTDDPVQDTVGCLGDRVSAPAQPTSVTLAMNTGDGTTGERPGSLQTTPNLRLTIDGQPRSVALRPGTKPGFVMTDVDYHDVRISVQASSSVLIAILTSVRSYTTDPLGCAATIPSQIPSQDPASALVPGHPTGAHVCDYASELPETTGNLVHIYPLRELDSSTLTAATTARLAATLNALPQLQSGRGSATFPRWIVFTYADGSTHTVLVDRLHARAAVTDGITLALDNRSAVYHLLNGVR